MPITIKELADHRLGHEAVHGGHFLDAGLDILGGCEVCEATLAAYNAYPSHAGYWRCSDHIGDEGWDTVEAANADIFGGILPEPDKELA